ncbi:hypothetical protein GQ53DRAFT_804762 [Thozetella sp. PMI_491]|nr:hypothetical protein GQ53DRAFT_804762 [Thozetella sp. PMI_491]
MNLRSATRSATMERIKYSQIQSPFFRELPPELRNIIYQDILSESGPKAPLMARMDKRMYDESLPLMGSAIQFVFTDMQDARKFLLEKPPRIVKEIKVIHMAWGVIWSTAPSRIPNIAESSRPRRGNSVKSHGFDTSRGAPWKEKKRWYQV